MGLEKRLGFRHEATLLEKSEPGVWLTTEHKVGCDREQFDKAKVLVDDRDPSFPRFRGAAESDRPAFDLDRTSVEAVDAAEDLDERRLAGAVLPKQRMNLARPHLEADAAQRPNAAEGLRHALDADKRVCGNGSTGGGRWSYHSGSNISSLTAASPRPSLTFHYDPEIRQAHGGCPPLAAARRWASTQRCLLDASETSKTDGRNRANRVVQRRDVQMTAKRRFRPSASRKQQPFLEGVANGCQSEPVGVVAGSG